MPRMTSTEIMELFVRRSPKLSDAMFVASRYQRVKATRSRLFAKTELLAAWHDTTTDSPSLRVSILMIRALVQSPDVVYCRNMLVKEARRQRRAFLMVPYPVPVTIAEHAMNMEDLRALVDWRQPQYQAQMLSGERYRRTKARVDQYKNLFEYLESALDSPAGL